MGNLKTALRLGLGEGHSIPAILDRANGVLPAVKESEMYATVAAVRAKGARLIEYAVAGHLPILHYHAAGKFVRHCRMEQVPLGLIPECNYESPTAPCEVGDLFALMNDGIVETEDALGSEFGLERPLTLHGGSGTDDEDFRKAIAAGINVIHINTEPRVAWRRGLEDALRENPNEVVPYKLLQFPLESIKQVSRARMMLFNGEGLSWSSLKSA